MYRIQMILLNSRALLLCGSESWCVRCADGVNLWCAGSSKPELNQKQWLTQTRVSSSGRIWRSPRSDQTDFHRSSVAERLVHISAYVMMKPMSPSHNGPILTAPGPLGPSLWALCVCVCASPLSPRGGPVIQPVWRSELLWDQSGFSRQASELHGSFNVDVQHTRITRLLLHAFRKAFSSRSQLGLENISDFDSFKCNVLTQYYLFKLRNHGFE